MSIVTRRSSDLIASMVVSWFGPRRDGVAAGDEEAADLTVAVEEDLFGQGGTGRPPGCRPDRAPGALTEAERGNRTIGLRLEGERPKGFLVFVPVSPARK